MKKLTKFMSVFSVCILSSTLYAHEYCHYRFNNNLAVAVVVNDRMGENRYGSISWDNVNSCSDDGGCTEMDPGSFKVRFKDQTHPEEEGAIRFKVKSINSRDDLGNRYRANSQFGKFIREAQFDSAVNPEPQLSFKWKGKDYEMDCHSLDHR